MKINNNQSAREAYAIKAKSNGAEAKSKKDPVASKATDKSDTLNLSGEAVKLSLIREKIANGFYDRPEVLDSLASKLDSIISNNID